ncbi:tryptophan transporter [Halobacillus litoralis]|uniref:tryptophan transporter n=1 Tax=Halobacillus litoralis TaxID=45668 RepID=UPI001CD19E1A|nr:tryptophan transporter [Halobacillus litoralis]MCA0969666.1 tryptophan transporter [Halobacillus litoralis]
MNTRVLVMLSLLAGIGAVLHTVIPGVVLGMKPDMMLAMLFLGILLFPKPSYVLLLSIVTGLISGLTTAVPGGQIANVIEKPITAFAFLGLVLLTKRLARFKVTQPALAGIGTLISGTVFLTIVLYVLGMLQGSFAALFLAVVLPTTAFNVLFVGITYPIITTIMKRTSLADLSPALQPRGSKA